MFAVPEETQPNIINVDGLLIDEATGEIVGGPKPFEVTDELSAEWVLERIANAEADALRARIKLQAVTERLKTEEARATKRAEWFRQVYGGQLEQFARERLKNTTKRSVNLAWGSIEFRHTKARIAVKDEEKAILWAKDEAPDAVKVTEKFLVSKLTESQQLIAITAVDAFEVVPAGESVTIKTGVK